MIKALAEMTANRHPVRHTKGIVIRSLLVGSLFTLLPGACLAADAIKFSRSTNSVVLPDELNKEFNAKGPGNFKDNYDPMGYMPYVPPAQSSGAVLYNNKKLQEFIDQRKNWIFVTPDVSMETMKESLEGKKASPNTSMESLSGAESAKSSRMVDRYMKQLDANRETPAVKRNSSSRMDEELGLAGPRNIGVADLQSLGNAKAGESSGGMDHMYRGTPGSSSSGGGGNNDRSSSSLAPAMSSPGQQHNAMGTLDRSKMLQTEADKRFQQLLRPMSAADVSLAGSSSDPINGASDSTTRSLQPTTSLSLEHLANDRVGRDPMGNLNPGNGQARQVGIFGEMNARVAGGSSLTPAFIVPSPAAGVAPQPLVLPMPKRKF